MSIILLILFIKSSWREICSVARNLINSVPQAAVKTFALSSVFILLLWGEGIHRRYSGLRVVTCEALQQLVMPLRNTQLELSLTAPPPPLSLLSKLLECSASC